MVASPRAARHPQRKCGAAGGRDDPKVVSMADRAAKTSNPFLLGQFRRLWTTSPGSRMMMPKRTRDGRTGDRVAAAPDTIDTHQLDCLARGGVALDAPAIPLAILGGHPSINHVVTEAQQNFELPALVHIFVPFDLF